MSQITISLHDAFVLYRTAWFSQSPSEVAKVQTTLARFLIPHWGFQVPAGRNFQPDDTEVALEFMKKVPLEDLGSFKKVLCWQAEVFNQQGTGPSSRRQYKFHLKKFLEWCKDQGLFTPKLEPKAAIGKYVPPVRSVGKDFRTLRVTKRKSLSPYYLYPEKLIKESPSGLTPQQLEVRHKALERLQAEMDNLEAFWTDSAWGDRPVKQVRKSTFDLRYKDIQALFGWIMLTKDAAIGPSSKEFLKAENTEEWSKTMSDIN